MMLMQLHVADVRCGLCLLAVLAGDECLVCVFVMRVVNACDMSWCFVMDASAGVIWKWFNGCASPFAKSCSVCHLVRVWVFVAVINWNALWCLNVIRNFHKLHYIKFLSPIIGNQKHILCLENTPKSVSKPNRLQLILRWKENQHWQHNIQYASAMTITIYYNDKKWIIYI